MDQMALRRRVGKNWWSYEGPAVQVGSEPETGGILARKKRSGEDSRVFSFFLFFLFFFFFFFVFTASIRAQAAKIFRTRFNSPRGRTRFTTKESASHIARMLPCCYSYWTDEVRAVAREYSHKVHLSQPLK
jgi:hypothetical protein